VKFSFKIKIELLVLFQCTADSIKVEPCSDDETYSLLSFGEGNEGDHSVFIPVMKCEVKVSCVLNVISFFKRKCDNWMVSLKFINTF
jgi:hypothetical protein